jgi:hypothetical protein
MQAKYHFIFNTFKPKLTYLVQIQFLPQRKPQLTVTKINWLKLFKGTADVSSENRMKPINA